MSGLGKGNRLLYGLYDTKNNEICIGLFTSREIAERFNMTIASFNCTVCRRQLLRGRYEVVKFRAEELEVNNE